jgi:hypothetical protein
MSEGNKRAKTVTMLEYYCLPSVVVQRYRLEQEWAFEDKSWKIVSPFPELP